MILSFFRLTQRRPRFHSSFLYFAVSILTFIGLIIASLNARPIQDDYATLYLISKHGLFGYLQLTWETHGGNLTPMLINGLFLYPSLYELNFWGLTLFPLVNYLLLVFSIFSVSVVLNPLFSRSFTKIQIFTFANLVFLGSESLFSPQFLEMNLFTSAVLVHLWPVLFFFIALGLFNKQSKFAVIVLAIIGFMSGNSNISESLFIQLSCLLMLALYKYQNGLQIKLANLFSFAFSNLVGAILIISAPGFWVRAHEKNAIGIPDHLGEFAVRLTKSIVVFSGDIVSHPMLYIFVIVGYIYSSKKSSFVECATRFACLLFVLLFISLVIGATLAYPAWHQSIGLVMLTPFVGMSLGDWLGAKIDLSRRLEIVICSFVVLIVSITLARAFFAIAPRSQQWDAAFRHNVCVVESGKLESFIGTETIYPISNLGIEDLNRWPWMGKAFTEWVSNPKFSKSVC